MTHISRDDVQHLAQLSSLQLQDTEAASLRGDIERILGYVEQLSELDTTGVDPSYQVTGLSNVYREDTVATSPVGRDALLALAADTDSYQIKVPKVL
ncbi:MAG: Asp-tRNA(Asn)/Glu-tRNA(Gln) amidotransferase subunit GatC [Candidatus Saccharimonadales bacterium]